MMTIGIPVEREKELSEVAYEAWKAVRSQDGWCFGKWSELSEDIKRAYHAEVCAILDEAFRRLEANVDNLCIPIEVGVYRIDLLRACKNFLSAPGASTFKSDPTSANADP